MSTVRSFMVIALALGSALTALTASAAETAPEKNKRLVLEFYNLAFNQHRPIEAANKYLAENYIQHNPRVADGRAGFIDAFKDASPSDPSRSEIKRVLAEGDLVMLHLHGTAKPGDRGVAVVDIFRVKGDLITEHWDVGQKVPETAKNNNGMF